MRSLLLVLGIAVVGLIGCTGDGDPWPIHPPGHTGGGGGGDDDDGVTDGGVDGGGGSIIAGEVCVITAFENPFACLNIVESHDVLVEVVGSSVFTRSLSDGSFEIVPPSTPATLARGSAAPDGLETTDSILAASLDARAPAVDSVLWDETLGALLEIQTTGAMVIYIENSDGNPVSGASIAYVGAGQPSARLYYDDGVGGWDNTATTTGPDGIALVLDTVSAEIEASLGTRAASEQVYARTGTIGIATITLPD
jgi:hypothetical protein